MKVIADAANNADIPRMQVSCLGKGFYSQGQKPCGSLLEIMPMDIQIGTHTDYGGGTDSYYYIVCPLCGCKTEVSKSQMPSAFKSLI